MRRAKSWLFMAATALVFSLLANSSDAALPFKKVSIAKTPASTSSTTTTSTTEPTENAADEDQSAESSAEIDEGKSDNVTSSKNSKLTGIPQIDYIWDPNLPRELHGYNLSSYPFHSTVPPADEIHFKCEGLHDGFYASIEHKCQVYHHCVYGIRHDFLCANFTAFDQRTFICHFASDVDCEGSQKYWSRNDELYMATTTTSTSTTTTQPPPLAPRRRPMQRPGRPFRRPYNRRPIDDYFYEDADYEDDYYEERQNRRPKPRPRQRKPAVDYDDEYEEEPREVEKSRRNIGRNRYRDEEELGDDYDERRNRPRARPGKSSPAAERRKVPPAARKPGRADERRSFNEERPAEDSPNTRRLGGGRRRNNEKRPTPAALDELDEYEKPYGGADQEEAAEEQAPQQLKTTPKPLEEYITPKAAPASVYARPRAPPRIARPVPINEKKKYQYPVVKSTATTPANDAAIEDDDYDQQPLQQQEDDYEEPQSRNEARRRTAAPSEDPVEAPLPAKRRQQKPTRPPLRKPTTEKKPLVADYAEDYESERDTRPRKRPLVSRTRTPAPDVDFADEEEYEERTVAPSRGAAQRLRNKAARKPLPRPRQPIAEPEDELVSEAPVKARGNALSNTARRNNNLAAAARQRAQPTSRTTPEPPPVFPVEDEEEPLEAIDEEELPAAKTLTANGRTASVRVVKRPFLPSRGGSPYLPRGLQPVGVALRPINARTTDSTPIDMGSTISGVRLLEHGAPLLRDAGSDEHDDRVDDDEDFELSPPATSPRTTLPPRSPLPTAATAAAAAAKPQQRVEEPQPQPKVNLDELYENDYDVTLNDALDPTLKPLTPQHHPHLLQNQNQNQHQQSHQSYSRPYASAYAAAPPPAISSAIAANAYNSYNNNNNNNNNNYQQQLYQPQSSIHQSQQQHQQQQYHPATSSSSSSASQSSSASASAVPQSPPAPNYHSDSYFSSTDIRRRSAVPAQAARSHRHEYRAGAGAGAGAAATNVGPVSHRLAQHFYDDFTY